MDFPADVVISAPFIVINYNAVSQGNDRKRITAV